jgi:hypothetical protein
MENLKRLSMRLFQFIIKQFRTYCKKIKFLRITIYSTGGTYDLLDSGNRHDNG